MLRNGIATASNDDRLGAQEAPPAIISIHTGQAMEDHIDKIIAGTPKKLLQNRILSICDSIFIDTEQFWQLCAR